MQPSRLKTASVLTGRCSWQPVYRLHRPASGADWPLYTLLSRSDTVCWIVLRESYPNHTRITPVSYLKPSTSRPWHILNAWVRYLTSLHNPENKTSLPIPPWQQSYGLNQPPAVRNKRASYSQLCLEPTIPAVRTSLGRHPHLGKPHSGKQDRTTVLENQYPSRSFGTAIPLRSAQAECNTI